MAIFFQSSVWERCNRSAALGWFLYIPLQSYLRFEGVGGEVGARRSLGLQSYLRFGSVGMRGGGCHLRVQSYLRGNLRVATGAQGEWISPTFGPATVTLSVMRRLNRRRMRRLAPNQRVQRWKKTSERGGRPASQTGCWNRGHVHVNVYNMYTIIGVQPKWVCIQEGPPTLKEYSEHRPDCRASPYIPKLEPVREFAPAGRCGRRITWLLLS